MDRAPTPPPPRTHPPLTRDRNARAKRPAGRGVQSQGDSRLTHATQAHVWFPAQGGGGALRNVPMASGGRSVGPAHTPA